MNRRALFACLAGALLAAGYVFSFLFAQASPNPHALPIGLVGQSQATEAAARAIERRQPEAFVLRRPRTAESARQLIRDREIYAALVPGPKPRLLTSPAGGQSAVTLVGRRLPGAADLPRTPTPQIEQVRPLVPEDADGQALNLVIFPMVILSVVVPILLLTLAPGLPIRSRLAGVALSATLGGALVALVTRVWLGALPGSYFALAGVCVLLLFAVGSATTAFVGLLGPPGILASLVLFLIVGNVASGASVVPELLPGFWRVVGPWLPPGAAASSLRGVAYFDAAKTGQPLLVLAGWCLLGSGVSLLVGDRRPAPQGDPAGPQVDQRAVVA